MIIYGSSVCLSTIKAIDLLKEKNIDFEFKDFCTDIKIVEMETKI